MLGKWQYPFRFFTAIQPVFLTRLRTGARAVKARVKTESGTGERRKKHVVGDSLATIKDTIVARIISEIRISHE